MIVNRKDCFDWIGYSPVFRLGRRRESVYRLGRLRESLFCLGCRREKLTNESVITKKIIVIVFNQILYYYSIVFKIKKNPKCGMHSIKNIGVFYV